MNSSAAPPMPSGPSKPSQNPSNYPPLGEEGPPPNQLSNQSPIPPYGRSGRGSGGEGEGRGGGGGGGAGQALLGLTIKFYLKPKNLPRWNGDRYTVISYFWKCQHLTLFGGQMPVSYPQHV